MSKVQIKDDPTLIRKLELLSIDLYPTLGSGTVQNPKRIEEYEKATTVLVGGLIGPKKLIKQDEIDQLKTLDLSIREGFKQYATERSDALLKAAHFRKMKAALITQIKELEKRLRECEQSKSLDVYAPTKERREKALAAMDVVQQGVSEWDISNPSDCIQKISTALDSRCNDAKRVQLIFPGLRFNEDILNKLVEGLPHSDSAKPRVFVYHDSHSTDEASYGKKWCIKIPKGEEDNPILFETYQSSLNPDNKVDFSEVECDDQIIMLYDDTNKQGGDYGIVSRSDERSPISQLIFLDIAEEGSKPRETLSSGDLYQAQCRRRNPSDKDPAPIVFAPDSSTQMKDAAILENLPLSILYEAIKQKMGNSGGNTDLGLAYLDSIKDDRKKLIESFNSNRCTIDHQKHGLIASLEQSQTRIESFLQQATAVTRIAERLLKIQAAQERASPGQSLFSESIVSNLAGRIKDLKNDMFGSSLKLEEMWRLIPKIRKAFETLKKAQQDLADQGKTPAPAGGATSLSGHVGSVLTDAAFKKEVKLFQSAVIALGEIADIEAYLEQSGVKDSSQPVAQLDSSK